MKMQCCNLFCFAVLAFFFGSAYGESVRLECVGTITIRTTHKSMSPQKGTESVNQNYNNVMSVDYEKSLIGIGGNAPTLPAKITVASIVMDEPLRLEGEGATLSQKARRISIDRTNGAMTDEIVANTVLWDKRMTAVGTCKLKGTGRF